MPSTEPRRVILASHLILTGYGHWLPNDLRGSGSQEIRREALKPLGDVLPGRQIPQPPRSAVGAFFREADGKLEQERIWFRPPHQAAIAGAFAEAIREHGYTPWACVICSNHAHLVIRTHRDRSETIWRHLSDAAKLALRGEKLVPPDHPVWSQRPYKVFLYSRADVIRTIDYVNANPAKEGLEDQHWPFVQALV